MRVQRVAKAVVSGLSSAAAVASAALADDVLGVDEVGSLVTTLVTVGVGVYAVWRTPNAAPPA